MGTLKKKARSTLRRRKSRKAIEDRQDLRAALLARKEKPGITLEKLKADLGF